MKLLFSIHFLKIMSISIVIFIVLDLLWLAVISKKLYSKELGYLAAIENEKIQFILPVGLLVQAIISIGLSAFIFLSIQIDSSLLNSILTGTFLGFVLYCTYDLTNLSFIKGYSVKITVIDIAWGSLQGFFAGIYVYFFHNLLR